MKPPLRVAEPSIKKAATLGIALLMLQSLSTRATGFVSQLVLAWLLAPADFGRIGLANTVAFLVNALVAFGIDEVLLQRQRTMRALNSTAVWFSAGLGILGMVVILIAAPVAQHAYGAPGLAALMVPIALTLPIGVLSTVPGVLLRARLEFPFLAGWGTIELMLTQALTILLASLGWGAFSFTLPLPFVAALRVAVFWYKAPLPVSRRIRAKQLRYLVGRGATVFAQRVITEIIGQGDYFLLGMIASPAVVGMYYFAFRLAAQPMRMLAASFSNVAFSALVRLNDDPPRQRAAAVNAALILSYIVMPVCCLQAALTDPAIRMLFGAKWVAAIPMMQVLSLGLSFDAIGWMAGALLHARGAFRRNLRFSLITLPFFFAVAAVGAWQGLGLGIAIAVSVYYVITPTVYSCRVFRSYGATWRQLLNIYVPPLCLSAATIGGAYLLSLVPFFERFIVLRLAVIAGVGPAAYAACVYIVDRPVFDEIAARLGLGRVLSRLAGRKRVVQKTAADINAWSEHTAAGAPARAGSREHS